MRVLECINCGYKWDSSHENCPNCYSFAKVATEYLGKGIVEELKSKNEEMLDQLKDYHSHGVTADCTCEPYAASGSCPHCQLGRLIKKMEEK